MDHTGTRGSSCRVFAVVDMADGGEAGGLSPRISGVLVEHVAHPEGCATLCLPSRHDAAASASTCCSAANSSSLADVGVSRGVPRESRPNTDPASDACVGDGWPFSLDEGGLDEALGVRRLPRTKVPEPSTAPIVAAVMAPSLEAASALSHPQPPTA